MQSPADRFLRAFVLVLASVSAASAAPAAPPSPQQIARWIEQLGDSKFSVREKASKQLWAAGSTAEPALNEALKSEDAEVVRRARDILDKFAWGIYPDTPADIVALIRAYQSAQDSSRRDIAQKLLQAGPAGLQAAVKIAGREKDPEQRSELGQLVSEQLPAALVQALEQNDHARFEILLEIGHESEVVSHSDYTAYWFLRGELNERIAHFHARLAQTPKEKRLAETLIFLQRARGDWAAARQEAEKAGNDRLLDTILYESADWKALAARKEFSGAHIDIEKHAFAAAFARLAGKPKECANALGEVGKAADRTPVGERYEFTPSPRAKALFLNDRPVEALDVLNKSSRAAMRFEILTTQGKYKEALTLAEGIRPIESKERKQVEVLQARLLYQLGERDKAQKQFDRLATAIRDGVDPKWVGSLLETEYRIGLIDRAFEHGGRALSVSPPKETNNQSTPKDSYLSRLFPKQTATAEVWWTLLRQRFKDEPPAKTLTRLRELIEGKTSAREVKNWIEEAERGLAVPNAAALPHDLVPQRLALAEAGLSAGLETEARALLEKTDAPETLFRLADLLAGKKDWSKAADRYRQAWRKSTLSLSSVSNNAPLSLYLAGDALAKAGQEQEGRKLMEQSHWIALGNADARSRFLSALTERGHLAAAQREADLLRRVCNPNSYRTGVAARRLGLIAAKRKDYLKAADLLEQSMLHCLNWNVNFTQPGAYIAVPARIHQLRAIGALGAGNLAEAQKHIELTLAFWPGSVDLPIQLVPVLESKGHKKEAAALFDRCYEVHAKVCSDYPRCAWANNSAAWMSACCRRNLDKALAHARKAVELAPDNAGYLDTLAEVHFQRGDKDKAIALEKRVIELNPKRAYFRKQLKRLQAGDPSAERPPENEDE